jgi:aldose 1-epimerase
MLPEPITITDAASGAVARILPAAGFNCYSFEVPTREGPRLETLWSAPEFAAGTGRPSASGIPLMFPFAGRLRGTSFRYGGKTFELVAGDGQGNAIHGFVIDRPWRVIEREAHRLRGEFHASIDEPGVLTRWPADFRIVAEYEVRGSSLVAEYTVDNPDQRPLPFGFGTHPYFRVPLGGPSSEGCRVTVPVADEWELEKLLPTGRNSATPLAANLAGGMAFSAMKLDHVFSKVRFENHRAMATVDDSQAARRLSMRFDDQFAAVVVYNPPHREAVCIEPYTTIPDAFTLAERSIETHLRVLEPGKSFATRIEIRVEDLPPG